MSGEFGENFKPDTKGAESSEEASEKHDALADFRSLKGDDSSKADKVENRPNTVADATKALYDKGYDETKHGSDYSDYLAKHKTPEENRQAFLNLMKRVDEKMNAASHHFDAQVSDATKEEVQRLYKLFESIDKKN